MKRTLIILAALAAMSLSANAQVMVGGSLGLTNSGSESTFNGTSTKGTTLSSFNIAPNIAYGLSDALVVGIKFGLDTDKENDNLTTATIKKENTLSIAPYARYKVAELGGLKLWGQAGLTFSSVKGETATGNNSVKDDPRSYISLNICPVVTYDLGEHLCLETYINCANLSYGATKIKGDNWSYSGNNINVGVGTSSILGAVGILYKF